MKVYVYIEIGLKTRYLTTFRMCVHYVNNYQNNLVMLHMRLVHAFITQTITRIVYEVIKEKAWLSEGTEMDREERLRRQREGDRARRLT